MMESPKSLVRAFEEENRHEPSDRAIRAELQGYPVWALSPIK